MMNSINPALEGTYRVTAHTQAGPVRLKCKIARKKAKVCIELFTELECIAKTLLLQEKGLVARKLENPRIEWQEEEGLYIAFPYCQHHVEWSE